MDGSEEIVDIEEVADNKLQLELGLRRRVYIPKNCQYDDIYRSSRRKNLPRRNPTVGFPACCKFGSQCDW
jgi:hypothetical protein